MYRLLKFMLVMAVALLGVSFSVDTASAQEDCSRGGGWACDPGTRDPIPYCPPKHTCPVRIMQTPDDRIVIFLGEELVGIFRPSGSSWHPDVLEAAEAEGIYQNGVLSIESAANYQPEQAISPLESPGDN